MVRTGNRRLSGLIGPRYTTACASVAPMSAAISTSAYPRRMASPTATPRASPVATPFMETIDRWIRAHDSGAETVPVILPGFSDSRWFREAFPDCAAYGFFPQRFMNLFEAGPLVHNADERIDVRDLGYAAGFYFDVAQEILG